MKKISIYIVIFLISLLSMGISFADYELEDFHEMTGIIVDKNVDGQSIDYLIDINGTICYLSSSHQPYEEFNVGDNVTMNGTFDDTDDYLLTSDFESIDEDGFYPCLVLNSIVENQHTYGQMRLTSDVDNQYYRQLDQVL